MNLHLRYRLRDGRWFGIVGEATGILRKAYGADRDKQEQVLFNILHDGRHTIYPGRVEIVPEGPWL